MEAEEICVSTGSFLQITTMEYVRFAERETILNLKSIVNENVRQGKSEGMPVELELRACSNVEVVPGFT